MRGEGAKRRWSEAEDRIITVHYPAVGPSGVVKMLKGRERKAVINRAFELGVKVKGHPTYRAWSKREDTVIRTHYPVGASKACAPLLPNRTRKAIRDRAQALGIRRFAARKLPNPIIRLPEVKRTLSFAEKLALVEQGRASLVPAMPRMHLEPRIAA